MTPGAPFDPREHEAIVNVPGSGMPGGSIVGELQRGYRIRDRVLRPALVAVAAHEPGDEPSAELGIAPGDDDAPVGGLPEGDDFDGSGPIH